MTKQKKKVRKPRELKKHLWKIKHPYQMTYGCYFNNDCHEESRADGQEARQPGGSEGAGPPGATGCAPSDVAPPLRG